MKGWIKGIIYLTVVVLSILSIISVNQELAHGTKYQQAQQIDGGYVNFFKAWIMPDKYKVNNTN